MNMHRVICGSYLLFLVDIFILISSSFEFKLPEFKELPAQLVFVSTININNQVKISVSISNNGIDNNTIWVCERKLEYGGREYMTQLGGQRNQMGNNKNTGNANNKHGVLTTSDAILSISSRQTLLDNVDKYVLQISRVGSILNRPLHIVVTNRWGSITSRPFSITRPLLNPFPLVHHESAQFLMGNVAQIVCMLPHSQPSPPLIQFVHNNKVIQVTKIQLSKYHTTFAQQRYRMVYLQPDTIVLLIRNLQLSDAGSYSCQASLPGLAAIQKSDKITRLTVKEPDQSSPPLFRLSSHDHGSSAKPNDDTQEQTRLVRVRKGHSITLYCLYESAPVTEVTWFWSRLIVNRKQPYKLDAGFGTLELINVSKNDEGDFSCLANEVFGRTFRIQVIDPISFVTDPSSYLKVKPGQSISIKCNSSSSSSSSSTSSLSSSSIFLITQSLHSLGSHKWLHNSQILMSNPSNNIIIRDNLLEISNISASQHQGIYQCWRDNDVGYWSANNARGSLLLVVNNPLTSSNSQINNEDNSIPITQIIKNGEVIDVITKDKTKTISGVTVHLECKFPKEATSKLLWYRWKQNDKVARKIDEGGNKFIMFQRPQSGILAIVNPTKKGGDEGFYICRLYDTKNKILYSKVFDLIVDTVKSGSTQSIKEDKNEQPNKLEPKYFDSNVVHAPQVDQLQPYVRAIRISWGNKRSRIQRSIKDETEVDHYRIEYQYSTHQLQRTPNHQSWRDNDIISSYDNNNINGLRRKQQRRKEEEIEWSDVILVDQHPSTQDNVMFIMDPNILRLDWIIRFRVISVPKTFLALPPDQIISNNSNYSNNPNNILSSLDKLRSPWSHPINFTDLMDCNIQLSHHDIAALSKPSPTTTTTITWTHNCVLPNQPIITYNILYTSFNNSVKHILPLSHLLLLTSPTATKVQYDWSIDNTIIQSNITNMALDKYYIIAVYGLIKPVFNIRDVYVPLSNIITIRPRISSSNKNGDLFIVSLPTSISTSSSPSISSSNETRNRVVFLVLGSLAGVLFVIAAVMFGMCTWYYMHKHIKIHKIQMKPTLIPTNNNNYHDDQACHPSLIYHYAPTSSSPHPQMHHTFNTGTLSKSSPPPSHILLSSPTFMDKDVYPIYHRYHNNNNINNPSTILPPPPPPPISPPLPPMYSNTSHFMSGPVVSASLSSSSTNSSPSSSSSSSSAVAAAATAAASASVSPSPLLLLGTTSNSTIINHTNKNNNIGYTTTTTTPLTMSNNNNLSYQIPNYSHADSQNWRPQNRRLSFSFNNNNSMSNNIHTNINNMTLPRNQTTNTYLFPITFPKPPSQEPVNNDLPDDNHSSAVPFLTNSSQSRSTKKTGSFRKSKFTDLFEPTNRNHMPSNSGRVLAQNSWMGEAYYDPYSSTSSLANDLSSQNHHRI